MEIDARTFVLAVAAVLAVVSVVRRLRRRGLERVDIDLSGVEVATAAGGSVRLGSLIERPTILALPRYYG